MRSCPGAVACECASSRTSDPGQRPVMPATSSVFGTGPFSRSSRGRYHNRQVLRTNSARRRIFNFATSVSSVNPRIIQSKQGLPGAVPSTAGSRHASRWLVVHPGHSEPRWKHVAEDAPNCRPQHQSATVKTAAVLSTDARDCAETNASGVVDRRVTLHPI